MHMGKTAPPGSERPLPRAPPRAGGQKRCDADPRCNLRATFRASLVISRHVRQEQFQPSCPTFVTNLPDTTGPCIDMQVGCLQARAMALFKTHF